MPVDGTPPLWRQNVASDSSIGTAVVENIAFLRGQIYAVGYAVSPESTAIAATAIFVP